MANVGTGPSAEVELLGHRRFQLKRRLGEGSMGAVYLAHDRERGVEVALKTLLRVDATSIYRFKREFRALSDVVHPNLVALHDLFHEGELWFFTMEYVQGQDFLAAVLGGRAGFTQTPTPTPSRTQSSPGSVESAGPERSTLSDMGRHALELLFPTPVLDMERLRDVLVQISRGLLAIHSAGKLHRDLKSENVLVTEAGRAKVLDFGIVIDRPSVHGTIELGVMGTPAYMSPEQAAGLPVTEATDWYSLGVMLYEALTGSVPFDGSYLEVMRQKQIADAIPPSQVVAGVPKDLDELCVLLLKRNPNARPQGGAVLRALEERSAPVARSGGSSSVPAEGDSPFVGREEQLAALRRHLTQTDQSKPVVTLLQGPSGIGKTTLIERFIAEVRSEQRAVVLKGRCYEREAVPFKAFDSLIDALSRYLRRLPQADSAEALPRDIHALAHLFPVLRRVEAVTLARRRTGLPTDRHEQRRRAFGALKEMFCRIADRTPLVLIIDDLQWGDVDSARLIAELLSPPEAPALLLLLAYRGGEARTSACLSPLLPRLRELEEIELHELELGPLSEEQSVDLARQLLGGELAAAVQGIGSESRGSPHLVHELVRHVRGGRDSGGASPDTLSGVVSFDRALVTRVAELSAGARTLIELISVAGRPLPEESLQLLATSFDIELQEALLELRGDKLVRGVGTHTTRSIETYHDRVREAVVQALPLERLEQWHRRLASTLEATGSADLEAIVEHLIGARDYKRAQIYAIRAASQAAEALAFDKAARLFAVAVEHDADEAWGNELLVKWAESLVNAGHGRQAASVYLEAARAAADADGNAFRSKAGLQLLASGYEDEAVPLLADMLAALGLTSAASSTSDAVQLAAELRERITARGLTLSALPASTTAEDIDAAQRKSLEQLDGLLALATGFTTLDPVRAAPMVARATLDALDAGDPGRAVHALWLYHVTVDVPTSAALHVPWQGALAAAEELAGVYDEPAAHARVLLASGLEGLRLGHFRTAMRALDRAEELLSTRCAGVASELRLCRTALAYAAIVFLQLERFSRIEQWALEAEEHEDLLAATRLRLLRSLASAIEGNVEQALRGAAQAVLFWDREPLDLTSGLSRFVHAHLTLHRGQPDEAERALHAVGGHETRGLHAAPLMHGEVLLLRARLALLASRGADAPRVRLLELAEQYVRELSSLRVPLFEHPVRFVRAGIAAQRGDLDTALALLEAVLSDPIDEPTLPFTMAAARWVKGKLIGGEQGRWLVGSAVNVLREHGIAEVDAFFAPMVIGIG
jgi:serine/threonine protein kinase